MKRLFLLLSLLFLTTVLCAQELYFPPLSGNTWATTEPEELGWCAAEIDSLYQFLEASNSKAFIVLKDGRIVLERYFDSFTQDSLWYWASAGKTMTAFLVGLAQEQGFLDINDPTSDYLGTGWTTAPPAKEDSITIWHQLTMTSGLDDAVIDPFCTLPICLQYEADAGTRWAYHNGPYTLLTDVLTSATGQTHNAYLNAQLEATIGFQGAYLPQGFNRLLISTPRQMARFGLLMLAEGQWNGSPIMADMAYYQAMINSSQDINPSYGYLWWLNGKDRFRLPGLQLDFNFSLLENAPDDLYAAIGRNGQLINIVPSMNLVLIRMGEDPGEVVDVPTLYNNAIWNYFNQVLNCAPTSVTVPAIDPTPLLYPNPAHSSIRIQLAEAVLPFSVKLYNGLGQLVYHEKNIVEINTADFNDGLYHYQISQKQHSWGGKIVIQKK